jgi:hypothetical protein
MNTDRQIAVWGALIGTPSVGVFMAVLPQFIGASREWNIVCLITSAAIFVLYAAFILRIGRKSMSNSDERVGPAPSFDISDQGVVEFNRTPILGEIGGNIVKITGSGSFIMNDSVMVGRVPPIVDFPPPKGVFKNISSSDLKPHLVDLTAKLRSLQAEHHNNMRKMVFSPLKGEAYNISVTSQHSEFQNKFDQALKRDSLELASELASRAPSILRSSLTLDQRCGIDALIYGKLTGPNPASGIADFLENVWAQIA